MDITLLMESFVGLVSLLGVLIFFLLYSPSRKRKLAFKLKEERVKDKKAKVDFDFLVNVIRDKKSTSRELENALGLIINDYGIIDKFDIYGEIIIRICRHPNTTKDIILNFNRDIEKKNPRYAKEINSFIAKGLNSR